MMGGLGGAIGPVLGAAFFACFGYVGCFYTFGGFNIVAAFVILNLFPKA